MQRIGIDTGGTFTDLVGLDEHSGRLLVAKQPSTPDNPALAVGAVIDAVADPSTKLRQLVVETPFATVTADSLSPSLAFPDSFSSSPHHHPRRRVYLQAVVVIVFGVLVTRLHRRVLETPLLPFQRPSLPNVGLDKGRRSLQRPAKPLTLCSHVV